MCRFRLFVEQRRHGRSLGIVLAAAMLVGGCGTTRVVVDGGIPRPVMQKLPLRAGLVLPEPLVNLVHEESLPAGGDWAIELGAANADLFRQVVEGMFAHAKVLDRPDAGGVDIVLRPTVADFQFSTPSDSSNGFFETWIRYRVALQDPDGRSLGQLPISAYGRSPDRLIGDAKALRDASRQALRDAGAALVLALPSAPAVQALLPNSVAQSGSSP